MRATPRNLFKKTTAKTQGIARHRQRSTTEELQDDAQQSSLHGYLFSYVFTLACEPIFSLSFLKLAKFDDRHLSPDDLELHDNASTIAEKEHQ